MNEIMNVFDKKEVQIRLAAVLSLVSPSLSSLSLLILTQSHLFLSVILTQSHPFFIFLSCSGGSDSSH